MLFAPRGTPMPVVTLLNRELKAISSDPEIQKQLVANGFGPTPVGEVAELPDFVAGERSKWVNFIRAAGLKATQ